MEKINEEELKAMKDFVDEAYKSEDYVCWTMVHCLEKIIKEYEDEEESK